MCEEKRKGETKRDLWRDSERELQAVCVPDSDTETAHASGLRP